MNKLTIFIGALILVILLLSFQLYKLGEEGREIKQHILTTKTIEKKRKDTLTRASVSSDKVDKSSQQVLEEAKQYYEKAVLLFLANIGVKVNRETREKVDEMFADPEHFVKKYENQAIEDLELDEEKAKAYLKSKGVFRKEVQKLNSPFIEKGERAHLKNPMQFFNKTAYIENFAQLERYNGKYSGKLFWTSGPNEGIVDFVDMDLNFLIKDDNNITGNYKVELSRDGRVYSSNKGEGGNKEIRVDPQNPRYGIVFEVKPGAFFHFQRSRVGQGQYYENGQLRGNVFIERTRN